MWLLAEASIWRALLTLVAKEKGKLLEPMNHEETFEDPFLVVMKEKGVGGTNMFFRKDLVAV